MKKSLSRQLFIYFFIVILLSLSTVGIFSYLKSAEAIDEQVEKYMSTVITSAARQTDNSLQIYERISNTILMQEPVKKFLDMDPTDSYEHYAFTNQIRKEVFEKILIQYPTQIHMMYVLGVHGRSIFDQNQNFSSISVDPSSKLKELWESTPDNGEFVILKTSFLVQDRDRVITIARKIRGYSSYDPKGILAVEFNENQLMELWNQIDLGEQGFFFVLDKEGKVIFAPDHPGMQRIHDSSLAARIVSQEDHRSFEDVDGERMMIISRKSAYSGWSLVIMMPLKELRAPIASIGTTTLTVGAITLCTALIVAVKFGRSIVTPIRKLKNGMRQTEKGNWTQITNMKPREDEIGGLVHSYNLMVSRLSDMIEQVYHTELTHQKTQLMLQRIQLERQQAEFQALQLQINPHFLYNTLETIHCYAIMQDSDEISHMVEAMSYMLRYSIQTDLEEITIANELNHVRHFLMIINHRIGMDFEIEVLTPPELLLLTMVRLTLQPIVENVFQHAFPDGIQPNHFIRIDTKLHKDQVQVIVEDNGAGMDENTLHKLRRRLQENKSSEEDDKIRTRKGGGIGLLNVHRRIQMVYGEIYGITIESNPLVGTRIILTMPRGRHLQDKKWRLISGVSEGGESDAD